MKKIALFGILTVIALCFLGCSESTEKTASNSASLLISNGETEGGEVQNEKGTQSHFERVSESPGKRFLEAHSGKTNIEGTETRGFDPNAEHGVPIEWSGIHDSQTAGIIASAILEQYQSEGFFTTFKLFSVEHDTEEGIWVVRFWEDVDYPGSDLTIAISERTAEIIRVWAGE